MEAFGRHELVLTKCSWGRFLNSRIEILAREISEFVCFFFFILHWEEHRAFFFFFLERGEGAGGE